MRLRKKRVCEYLDAFDIASHNRNYTSSYFFGYSIMICVSIGRGRHKMMRAEHQHLAEQGAKLVELRLDYINNQINLKRLLKDRPCPVVATLRRKADQGRWEGTEAARQMILRAAIVEGVEYVDLEEDIAGAIPRYGDTKRVISLHNFRETPKNLEEIHERMKDLDPDIIKIATMAHDPSDNLRMLELVRSSEIPTVGLCMGEIGVPSRILAGKFGSPFTYATFHHERALAPGQLSYKQMLETYDYENIKPDTAVYGVIADPVGHSLSPILHNAMFRKLEMNAVYVPFRVPREDLDNFLRDSADMDIKGLSVTIPHKEAAISFCNEVTEAVDGIGAANTMVFEGTRVRAFNTDYQAALSSLLQIMNIEPKPKALEKKKALVLGAGGVARALIYGLKRYGAEVFVSSRTHSRVVELASEFQVTAVEWDDRYGVGPDILVNGTPIGMHPNVDQTPYEKSKMVGNMVVFDTVYNPERTMLVKEAREIKCRVVTGVDMFVRQAAIQFKHFTGVDASLTTMREELKRAIGPAKY